MIGTPQRDSTASWIAGALKYYKAEVVHTSPMMETLSMRRSRGLFSLFRDPELYIYIIFIILVCLYYRFFSILGPDFKLLLSQLTPSNVIHAPFPNVVELTLVLGVFGGHMLVYRSIKSACVKGVPVLLRRHFGQR